MRVTSLRGDGSSGEAEERRGGEKQRLENVSIPPSGQKGRPEPRNPDRGPRRPVSLWRGHV